MHNKLRYFTQGITNTIGAVPGIVGVALTGYLLDSTHSWSVSASFIAFQSFISINSIFPSFVYPHDVYLSIHFVLCRHHCSFHQYFSTWLVQLYGWRLPAVSLKPLQREIDLFILWFVSLEWSFQIEGIFFRCITSFSGRKLTWRYLVAFCISRRKATPVFNHVIGLFLFPRLGSHCWPMNINELWYCTAP